MFNKQILSTITILYVEPCKDIRESLGSIFKSCFKYCVPVATPAEAIEQFSDNPNLFDVIVSETKLPGMTGMDMITELRKHRSVPILYTTSDASYAIHALNTGASYYTLKPVNTPVLLENIQAAALVAKNN